jgi:monooxygenase
MVAVVGLEFMIASDTLALTMIKKSGSPAAAEPPADDVDVLVVGAGLSGIAAGHYLRTQCPWASFRILESRPTLGGTWDLFRYPGIRSDSDMFTLGYSFRPWQGAKSIADGTDILAYLHDTAREEGIDDHIRFDQRVTRAEWRSDYARWTVDVEHPQSGATSRYTCRFLLSCTGYYRYDRGYTPEFDGIERFRGAVIHPQAWPEDFDATGRRIVVIGSGATAITLIPALARTAAHVTMLQRSPTYVAAAPDRSRFADALRRWLPRRRAGWLIRWWKMLESKAQFDFCRAFPRLSKRLLVGQVKQALPAGYDVERHFTPHYDPWDQRVCIAPSGDLFRCIRDGSATVVTDHIDTFDETGLVLRSGQHLDADVVVTATGLDLLFLGGMTLQVDGSAVEPKDTLVYRGMMLEDVPNFAMAIGYTNASWTLKCELTFGYVCRLLNHMRHHGRQSCVPTAHGTDVSAEPVLGLSSGYVQRAADRFPQQGSRAPWRVHQNVLRDYGALRLAKIDDGTLRFDDGNRRDETAMKG